MLFGCSPCCGGCSKCTDRSHTRLIASLEYGGDGGETIAASEGNYGAVTTDCQPAGGVSPVIAVTLDTPGSGYTSAPTLAPSSGTATFTAEVRQSLQSVEVTSGGSGYTSPPTVTISGGVAVTAAAATAVVRGGGTAAVVTNGGSLYTSPPTVSASVGSGLEATAVMSGYVYAIEIASGGSGYTSAPTVSVSGGGGSGCSATASISPDGAVTVVTVVIGGSGYTSAPTVTISGGGGTGAAAVAVLRYRVASVSIQSGGSGYPLNAPLAFEGGGGSGAAGTLTVSGSVAEIVVTNPGLYRNASGAIPIGWPTVAISGGGGAGATATPHFTPGGVYSVGVQSGGSYSAPPALSFSGGGGSGAEATAYIMWQQSGEIGLNFVGGECFTAIDFGFCSATESEDYPLAPCIGCGGSLNQTNTTPPTTYRYGENRTLSIRASTSGAAGTGSPAGRSLPEDIRSVDYTPGGEYVFVYHGMTWSVPSSTVYDERLWARRLFSRVPPTGTWAIWQPTQPSSAVQPVLTPVCKQTEDLAGQPVWWLESFTITSPGSNLYVPQVFDDEAYVQPANGNLGTDDTFFVPADVEYTYSTPVATSFDGVAGFSQPPSLSFGFTSSGNGNYTLTSVSVNSPGGGSTLADGDWPFTLSNFSVGHVVNTPSFLATIVNGGIQSASVSSPGLVRGGASLSSIAVQDVPGYPGYSYYPRILIGRSNYKTTVTYSQPTVVATAPPGNAVFSVSLASGTDVSGNPFWYVSAVSIISGGSGYYEPVGLDFTATGADGVEAIPAIATASPPNREQPTLSIGGSGNFTLAYSYDSENDVWSISSVTIVDGGTGYEDGQYAAIVLGEDDSEVQAAEIVLRTGRVEPTITLSVAGGSGAVLEATLQETYQEGYWMVSSVTIIDGGSGYENGAEVIFSGGDQEYDNPYATVTTDESGAIVSVDILFGGYLYSDNGIVEDVEIYGGGLFYKQRTHLASVTLISGGKYFNRTITATVEPLDTVECSGEVSEENGWELIRYKPPADTDDHAVGDTFQASTQAYCNSQVPSVQYDFTRTRRCGFPDITFRIE